MPKDQFPPLERNPVILSLIILKEMEIPEESHPKFSAQWKPFWDALVAYRDATKKSWDSRILRGILSGQATFDSGPEWVQLNQVLNEIWARANP